MIDLGKGICRLSVVPIREHGSDKAEMTSQMLFGDHYHLLAVSANKKWYQIQVHYDGFVGWIDYKQHTEISDEYFNQVNNSDYKISTSLTGHILFKKQQIPIVLGSVLPISTHELFKNEEQLSFDGEAKSLNQRRDFEFMKTIGMQYMHAPYAWGGKSPFGIDCSGLSQNLFKICGYKLKRDAKDQATQGVLVDSIKKVIPGDLAFFQNDSDIVTHVGIALEDGKILHASGKVRIDKLDENGIFVEETNAYSHRFHSLKRMFKK